VPVLPCAAAPALGGAAVSINSHARQPLHTCTNWAPSLPLSLSLGSWVWIKLSYRRGRVCVRDLSSSCAAAAAVGRGEALARRDLARLRSLEPAYPRRQLRAIAALPPAAAAGGEALRRLADLREAFEDDTAVRPLPPPRPSPR
jgi:hypothetical protein